MVAVERRTRTFALLLAGACMLTVACNDDSGSGSTTSSSSTSTMVITSTTETTMASPSSTIIDIFPADVTFSLIDAVTVGALQFDVGYGRAVGRFVGNCTNLVPNALTSANNDLDSETLRIGMVALDGFTGPIDLMTCKFMPGSTEVTMADDFDLTIVDVTAPDLTPIVPAPVIEITVESLL